MKEVGILFPIAMILLFFKIGGVYQITYDHLTDANGNETSYSYRTVYEKSLYWIRRGESTTIYKIR